MNGYYIIPTNRKNIDKHNHSSGVEKKVERHLKQFNKLYDTACLVLVTETGIKEKIKTRIPLCSKTRNYNELLEAIKDPCFVYIRRENADRKYLSFLKEIKKRHPECKILIEIYTYPYDIDAYFRDLQSAFRAFPVYLKDLVYRHRMKGTVDRFVTYSNDDEIFGVKTIKTINGYDFSQIKPNRADNAVSDGKEIHLISVSFMQNHHGFERIIEGLAEYYRKNKGNRKIVFHIVGDGLVVEKYKRLVSRRHLEPYVIFYGKKTGDELEPIYKKADIGVCSFGMYKIGIDYASSLKIPEYLAKGLPIIAGSKISMMNNEKIRYCLEFRNDSSSVNMDRIVQFYDDVYSGKDRASVAEEIHQYAEQHFDENRTFKPILDYIANG